MKIFHFSDSHLGFNDLDKVGANGVNLREQDFYDAFIYTIDRILEIQPDVVVHSGDFFHRPSPPNRPMIVALEQLNRLSAANIPIVMIAGNHETPKTIFTSPILAAFKTVKGVYPIFSQQYDSVEFGDLVIHGLPHINDDRILLEEMDKIKPISGKSNIILLHTSIGKSYIMEEFGEKLFPPERLELLNQFDYVALGHWHNFQKVKVLKTGWYSGSTERMSDTEAGKEKGYVVLDLTKGKKVEPVFHTIPARPWFRYDVKKCSHKTIEDIEIELKNWAAEITEKDAILSIYFHQIETLQSIAISQRRLVGIFPEALNILAKRLFVQSNSQRENRLRDQGKTTLELLDEFIRSQTDVQAEQLSEKARYYFHLFESGEYRNR